MKGRWLETNQTSLHTTEPELAAALLGENLAITLLTALLTALDIVLVTAPRTPPGARDLGMLDLGACGLYFSRL